MENITDMLREKSEISFRSRFCEHAPGNLRERVYTVVWFPVSSTVVTKIREYIYATVISKLGVRKCR